MVDLQDRLVALMEAEMCSEYRTVDYLSPKYQQDLRLAASAAQAAVATAATAQAGATTRATAAACGSSSHDPLVASTSTTTPAAATAGLESTVSLSSSLSSSSSSTALMSESWREKITEWTYQVIDHFNFSREIAEIVMNYLDRYLARCVPPNVVTKKMFQLAAMTSCYLAIKLYEPATINLETMIQLSRGFFTPAQMEAMELSILRTLSWRVHPPTRQCFCKHFMQFLPPACVPVQVMYDIADLARFLLELSVIDYYFIIHRPSNIALAAIMNAIEEVCGRSSSSSSSSAASSAALPTLAAFTAELCRFDDGRLVDPHTEDVLQCRSRLQILYEHGGYATSNDEDGMASPTTSSSSGVVGGEGDSRNETISSPVCVSHGLNNIQHAQTWTKKSNSPAESEETAATTATVAISAAPFTETEEVTRWRSTMDHTPLSRMK
mmetsp:Transcript_48881/g.118342  ORF Transcript_48881/g.118342 Transcript_48881/m.118342 type:complete len:439 (-) Transcript_48881:1060-2376(-)